MLCSASSVPWQSPRWGHIPVHRTSAGALRGPVGRLIAKVRYDLNDPAKLDVGVHTALAQLWPALPGGNSTRGDRWDSVPFCILSLWRKGYQRCLMVQHGCTPREGPAAQVGVEPGVFISTIPAGLLLSVVPCGRVERHRLG